MPELLHFSPAPPVQAVPDTPKRFPEPTVHPEQPTGARENRPTYSVWLNCCPEYRVSVVGASLVDRRFSHHRLLLHQRRQLWLLIHLLGERFVMFADNADSFVPVSSRYLRKIMGRVSYDWAKKVLKADGIIETDDYYTYNNPNAECIGYRFASSIAHLPAETRVLSGKLGRAIVRRMEAQAKRDSGRSPACSLIRANLRRLSLRPDYRAAVPDFDSDLAALAKRKGKAGKKAVAAILKRQRAWQLSINSVRNNSHTLSQTETTGRVYSSFSSFPKVLRGYALLDGEPTVEIDIANSQPLFLAQSFPANSAEAVRYRTSVEAGTFYEEVMAVAGLVVTPATREKLKKQLYSQVLFGINDDKYTMLQVFRKAYPELGEIVKAIKTRAEIETKKKRKRRKGIRRGHNVLAIELQKREAAVMIGKVIPRIAEQFPGVPVLPVHDSIVVPSRYAEEASRIIKEEVQSATGLTPTLRRTPGQTQTPISSFQVDNHPEPKQQYA